MVCRAAANSGAIINAVLEPEATIVDVGCGTGANLAGLTDRYSCVGIDASSEAIRLARLRFPAVEFIHGQAPSPICRGSSNRRAWCC